MATHPTPPTLARYCAARLLDALAALPWVLILIGAAPFIAAALAARVLGRGYRAIDVWANWNGDAAARARAEDIARWKVS